ncbi:WhiB family transcriptional regulator [Saccharopolyspora shandongensis]|uniref:WhiB family transcriptional regulator n=1 Tax=Saccharopolyspora shandongensis TaxID=418495 RepID=UPI0033D3B0C2
MSDENTRWSTSPATGLPIRHCRECDRQRVRRYRAKLESGERVASVRKGRCVRGHALTGDNVIVEKRSGKRRCAECRKNANRAYREKKASRPLPTWVEAMPFDQPEPYSVTASYDWPDSGCAGAPLDSFFPVDGEQSARPQDRHVETARQLCAGCPVRELCDKQATGDQEPGLWGGKWRYREAVTNRYMIVDLLHEEYPR